MTKCSSIPADEEITKTGVIAFKDLRPLLACYKTLNRAHKKERKGRRRLAENATTEEAIGSISCGGISRSDEQKSLPVVLPSSAKDSNFKRGIIILSVRQTVGRRRAFPVLLCTHHDSLGNADSCRYDTRAIITIDQKREGIWEQFFSGGKSQEVSYVCLSMSASLKRRRRAGHKTTFLRKSPLILSFLFP